MKEDINRFSLRRTFMLTGTELTEKRRTLLIQCGMVLLVLIVLALIESVSNDYTYQHNSGPGDPLASDLLATYMVMLFIFGGLSASIMFSDLGNKEGRIRMLMRPGLSIEKFLSRWLIYVGLFLVVYLLSVVVADTVRYIVLKSRFPESPAIVPIYASLNPAVVKAIIPSFNGVVIKQVLFCIGFYFGIQSFFVLGSVIWPRMSFPKTFGVFSALTFIYIMCTVGVVSMFDTGVRYTSRPFVERHADMILLILSFGAIAVNYVLTWLRLGETEVITTKR